MRREGLPELGQRAKHRPGVAGVDLAELVTQFIDLAVLELQLGSKPSDQVAVARLRYGKIPHVGRIGAVGGGQR